MDVPAPIGDYLTPSFEHARVRDAMRPWVLTCDPATPLVTVAQRMAGEHVHALVVLREGVDAGGTVGRRPWAVLTDRDVLRCAGRVEELTAGDAATGELLQVHADDRLVDVAERMLDHAVTHALVVDPETGRPVGVISTLDVARIVAWGRG
jgi:CBS domain-containing protein